MNCEIMNDYVNFNKVKGVYWLKSPIDSLTVRIKTKSQDSLNQLPNYENYIKPDTNIQKLKGKSTNECIFKWQGKVFSCFEIEKYRNVHNCITDTELAYFEILENSQRVGSKIFTYIHEDYRLPLPLDTTKRKTNISSLSSFFEKLNLEAVDKLNRDFNVGSSSTTNLFKSNENISSETDKWQAMHVVCDNSEYDEDSQLLSHQEAILLSLFYNATENYLIVSPDTNDLTENPYTVEGDKSGLQYAVELDYGDDKNEELVKMLSKLYRKWESKHRRLVRPPAPPLGSRALRIALEIVEARGFDGGRLYVEYHVKIPDEIRCNSTLSGRTHCARGLSSGDGEVWLYGHVIELDLDTSEGIVVPPIKVYLEVISCDWWGRERTEGYASLRLPLEPGWRRRRLACVRPEELDTVAAESRRFFLGGCHLIRDLDALDCPNQDANYRFATTGSVRVRWSTLRTGAGRGGEALRRYSRALAALRAVT